MNAKTNKDGRLVILLQQCKTLNHAQSITQKPQCLGRYSPGSRCIKCQVPGSKSARDKKGQDSFKPAMSLALSCIHI